MKDIQTYLRILNENTQHPVEEDVDSLWYDDIEEMAKGLSNMGYTTEQILSHINKDFGEHGAKYAKDFLSDFDDYNISVPSMDSDNVTELTEDYSERFEQILNIIVGKYSSGVKEDDLEYIVKNAAESINAVEAKKPNLLKELVNDIKEELKQKSLLIAPVETSDEDDNKVEKANDIVLQKIFNAIVKVTGEIFPDGDPLDRLLPWLMKSGYTSEEAMELLDLATEKYLGEPSLYTYLANMYSDFVTDNPGIYGLKPEDNPWKVKEEYNNTFNNTLRSMKELAGITTEKCVHSSAGKKVEYLDTEKSWDEMGDKKAKHSPVFGKENIYKK